MKLALFIREIGQIGQKPIFYCTGKLPHIYRITQRYPDSRLATYQLFSCSPNILRGFSAPVNPLKVWSIAYHVLLIVNIKLE